MLVAQVALCHLFEINKILVSVFPHRIVLNRVGGACRYCAAGAVVCDARGTTRTVVSCSPTASSSTTTSPLRAPAIVSVRISISSAASTTTTTSSSSSCLVGGCWPITGISRTSATRQSRCAAITSPLDSRNVHFSQTIENKLHDKYCTGRIKRVGE